MSKLTIEKFEGGTITLRSRFDDSIDWDASEAEPADLVGEAYDQGVNKIVYKPGAIPIGFNCRFPTRKDQAIARRLAGVDIGSVEKDGSSKLGYISDTGIEDLGDLFVTAEIAIATARVCLENVEHWDDWPAESGSMEIGITHEKGPAGSIVLKDRILPDEVLSDLGMYLWIGSKVSDTEKKGSASLHSGN